MKLFIFSLSLLLLSCSQPENSNSKNIKVNTSSIKQSIIHVDSAIAVTDSIEIIYYNNLNEKDNRYQRFFKYYATNELNIIKAIIENCSDSIFNNRLLDCKSDGKIYLRNKNNIINTLFFSYKKDSCSYVYIINNGNFYYTKIRKPTALLLQELKGEAKTPVSTNK